MLAFGCTVNHLPSPPLSPPRSLSLITSCDFRTLGKTITGPYPQHLLGVAPAGRTGPVPRDQRTYQAPQMLRAWSPLRMWGYWESHSVSPDDPRGRSQADPRLGCSKGEGSPSEQRSWPQSWVLKWLRVGAWADIFLLWTRVTPFVNGLQHCHDLLDLLRSKWEGKESA